MSTFLFDKTIFGPVKSRRLGLSLGVNLLPNDRKVCSFDCLYCECGFGEKTDIAKAKLPTRIEVFTALEAQLRQMSADGELPDVITFAGNGEPTLHPEFAPIIDDTLLLRNKFAPKAKVAVLSNATMLFKPDVVAALRKVDDNILKIDSGCEETAKRLDRPHGDYSLEATIEQIASFGDNLVVQTMFVRWEMDGQVYDNSSDEEVAKWLTVIERIKPPRLMIYTVARDTPLRSMSKVSVDRLSYIAEQARQFVQSVDISG